MQAQRTNFTPALIAAFLLHLVVLVGGLIAWPWLGKIPVQSGVTTVTLVNAPPAELRPVQQAPEPTPPSTETPEPTATAEPPAPQPTPAPPAPPPAAKPTPAPAKNAAPAPAPSPSPKPPAKPAAKEKSPGLDLDALSSSLSKSLKASGRRSSAPKGPARVETSLQAREGKGSADQATANAASIIGARLMRIWNPNCQVEGANQVVVRVRFSLTDTGALDGQPQLLDHGSGAVWQAAADRAIRAVSQAAPYSELPRSTYSQWKTFTAKFNGQEACR